MMLTMLAALFIGDTRMAVLDFSGSKVEPSLVSFCTQTYAARVAQGGGLSVTTQQDMSAVLGLERQKQLLGCNNDNSCVAELAGALDVRAIAQGQIARLGERLVLTIRVVDSSGNPLAALTAEGAEEQLPVILGRLAAQTRQALRATVAPSLPAVVEAQSAGGPPAWAPWVPIGVGGAAVVAGVSLLGLAGGKYAQLSDPQTTIDDHTATQLAADGKTQQTTGLILVGAGAAVLAGGVAWKLLLPAQEHASLAVLPTPQGMLVSVQGVLP